MQNVNQLLSDIQDQWSTIKGLVSRSGRQNRFWSCHRLRGHNLASQEWFRCSTSSADSGIGHTSTPVLLCRVWRSSVATVSRRSTSR